MMMVFHIYKVICKVMAVVGMTLSMACSCGKSADYVEPPHIVAPEPPVEPTYEKGEGVIRLVSYNVGLFTKYTVKYTNTIDMVAKMMLELQADAVCLNELDSCTTRTNKIFQSYELAKKMGNWHHFFGAAMPHLGGAYGEGMVVSPEFKNEGTYALALPKGKGAEPRVCAVFKTDKFVFLATHLDHVNAEAQLDGAIRITEWAKKNYGDSDIPVFLCGDMNCETHHAPIKRYKEDWTQISITENTYPAGPGKTAIKCIDFIFALNNKAKYEVLGSDVPMVFKFGDVSKASDHLPIYVDVKLK